jgi:hypothetical protein
MNTERTWWERGTGLTPVVIDRDTSIHTLTARALHRSSSG